MLVACDTPSTGLTPPVWIPMAHRKVIVAGDAIEQRHRVVSCAREVLWFAQQVEDRSDPPRLIVRNARIQTAYGVA